MFYYQSVLFAAFAVGLYSLALSFGLKDKFVKVMLFSIILLCLLRFVSLFVLYAASSQDTIYMLKYPALISIVGLPMLSYICIKYIKNKCFSNIDLAIEGCIALIYSYILFNAPKGIVLENSSYSILFNDGWQLIIAIALCSFSAIMVYITLLYFMKEKKAAIKLNYLLYVMGFVLCIMEYMLSILGFQILKENIISEMIIMISILLSVKNIKAMELDYTK